MDPETEKIFTEQLKKLPLQVITFISSANWDKSADEIGKLYNLSNEEIIAFKREITLVLVGLTHPDEFSDVLKKEVGVEGDSLRAIVKNVEDLIFTQVRKTLVGFVEKQDSLAPETIESEPTEKVEVSITTEATPAQQEVVSVVSEPTISAFPGTFTPQTMAPTQTPVETKTWEKRSDVAPDNLPVAEDTDTFMPPLTPKNVVAPTEGAPTHPFEEKMKKVFTGGQQSMGDLAIESPSTPKPQTPPSYHADPYREAIE